MEINFKEMFKVRPANMDGNKFMITLGDQLATQEEFTSQEDAEYAIENKDWNLIATLIHVMASAAAEKIINNKKK